MMRIRFILCLLPFLSYTLSLNILSVFHAPSRSHHILGFSLSKALADAGHHVTMLTPFGEPKLPERLKLIQLYQYLDFIDKLKSSTNLFDLEKSSSIYNIFFLDKLTTALAEQLFDLPQVQTLLKSNEHFDIVIICEFGSDSTKILAYHYKAPLVLFVPMASGKLINRYFANPEPPSYIPNLYVTMTNPLTFYERAYNAFTGLIVDLNFHLNLIHEHNAIVRKHFPNAPDLRDIIYNASLGLTNSHESINQPVPTVPNLIGIGGIHVNSPKKLPTDLQTFMDNAREGVIYFSMGSNLIPSQIPKHIKRIILKVLGNRKEKVIWKWDEDFMEDQPRNFVISKWFPQQEILGHPNCKLFVSHGGLLSTIESIAMGVPILAIPIYGDQRLNSARIVELEVGEALAFSQINEENFKSTLMEILKNPRYQEKAKLHAKLFHDRHVRPADLAVYWIEYIARYRGAPHLKVSGLDLSWYQYLLLDVMAVLLIGIVLLVFVIWKLCNYKKQKK